MAFLEHRSIFLLDYMNCYVVKLIETYRSPCAASSKKWRALGTQEQKMENRLASIAEASRRLGVSTFTTRRLIKAGEVRAVRVGKRVLIPQNEVERVIAEGCGQHTAKE